MQVEVAKCAHNLAGLLLAVESQPPAARPPRSRAATYWPKLLPWPSRRQRFANNCTTRRRKSGKPTTSWPAWRRKARASFAAFPGAWAELPRWTEDVVQAVAAACAGNWDALAATEDAMRQLAGMNDWQALPSIFSRILASERDLDSLTDDLDLVHSLII